jgi:hypothetical protein
MRKINGPGSGPTWVDFDPYAIPVVAELQSAGAARDAEVPMTTPGASG